MPTFQTNLSDEGLITAIRANLCDFFRYLSRSNTEEHFENGKFTRWYTSLPHPWFNGVLCSGLPQEVDGSFIEETISYFRRKNVYVFTWWMEPQLNASDWNAILSKHGFGFSNDTPGMAVDLRELNDSNTRVDGLEIRVVENENTMRMWAELFTQEYGLPTDWAIVIFDTWIKLGLDFPIRNYLGYLKDEPVSTSTIFFSEGVAGIYDVGTLPKARGRGIGGAMTLRPLHDALENGYRIAILQSSEMGYSVYKKLGFRHLCQIENYYRSLE